MHRKKQLIILSDMWGFQNSKWLEFYVHNLEHDFNIILYDARELAMISNENYDELTLHQQFLNGGIEQAVQNVLKSKNQTSTILAFSIGGTIAWKAILKGLQTEHLFAVSSTRLRYETLKPNSGITIFYGENDLHHPTNEWFETLDIKPVIYKNEDHEMYQKKEIAELICKVIIQKLSIDSRLS